MSVPFAGSLILYQRMNISTLLLPPATPLWLLLLGIQGHCNSSFPSTEEATFWYTMEYVIYLESYRTLDYLCFFSHRFLPYILLRCVFLPAHSSHSCVYLLKGAQFTIIQTEFITLSDEPHWGI